MKYIINLLKCIFNRKKKCEKIELNKRYIYHSDNPFNEDFVVIPVEIRGKYVRYIYEFSFYGSGSSIEISEFTSIYTKI